MEKQFIIATHNQKKGQEIIDILNYYGQAGVLYTDKIAQVNFPVETTTSYLTNATVKAEFISQRLPSLPVIADDSGLELAAYPHHYGVQTARELRAELPTGNLNTYLIDLVRDKDRQFTMKTTVVLARGGQLVNVGHGQLEGEIAMSERGNNSTGFDRIFIPTGQEKTLAEMDRAGRFSYLHRARAVKDLLTKLN
ncbi:non-canonical purine NTP pyrophosphatase [Limosilactobacillus caccae]|uniref:non-canonical purine NTP pyrophosphatase n=1 Tax=Limosilactobacillus caccae TaxID=1926284 RepID=UPI0009710686|nr:non-canonical purine NTP pyrophosphatase [Limosilactobacillus caccae]